MYFINDNVGFVVGGAYFPTYESGIVLKTMDGGATWTQISIGNDTALAGVWFTSDRLDLLPVEMQS